MLIDGNDSAALMSGSSRRLRQWITTGLLAVRWDPLRWTQGEAGNFVEEIVTPLRAFCARAIDAPAIGEGALLPWRDVSAVIERSYRDHLVGEAVLQDLPDRPRFVLNATNFMTGAGFRFSKAYAGDYRIGLMRNPRFPVALAVTASSAFPPFLSPVVRTLDPGSSSTLRERISTTRSSTDAGSFSRTGVCSARVARRATQVQLRYPLTPRPPRQILGPDDQRVATSVVPPAPQGGNTDEADKTPVPEPGCRRAARR